MRPECLIDAVVKAIAILDEKRARMSAQAKAERKQE